MNETAMMALAKELAKGLKTESDLNDFTKALKKLTIETALNVELFTGSFYFLSIFAQQISIDPNIQVSFPKEYLFY